MNKYEWTPEMASISDAEEDCETALRVLVRAGCEWLDANPGKDPQLFWLQRGKCVASLESSESREHYNAMSKALAEAFPGSSAMSGSMHQLVVPIVLWIKKNGWEAFVKSMIWFKEAAALLGVGPGTTVLIMPLEEAGDGTTESNRSGN